MKGKEPDWRDQFAKSRDKVVHDILINYPAYMRSNKSILDIAKLAYTEGHHGKVQQTVGDIWIVGASMSAIGAALKGTQNTLREEGRRDVMLHIEKASRNMVEKENERKAKLSKHDYKFYKMALLDVYRLMWQELKKV
jgi:hypothetical protein